MNNEYLTGRDAFEHVLRKAIEATADMREANEKLAAAASRIVSLEARLHVLEPRAKTFSDAEPKLRALHETAERALAILDDVAHRRNKKVYPKDALRAQGLSYALRKTLDDAAAYCDLAPF